MGERREVKLFNTFHRDIIKIRSFAKSTNFCRFLNDGLKNMIDLFRIGKHKTSTAKSW